jgi:AcrR family transcriptional regulator
MVQTATNASRQGRRLESGLQGKVALTNAALRLFSRNGFEGTTLRAIASEAGVDMALVARLFGSKRGLWDAVVDRMKEKRDEYLPQAVAIASTAAQSPGNALKDFIRLFANFTCEVPEFSALLINETAAGGERFEILLRELVVPVQRASLPILEAGIASGAVRGTDPRVIFDLLLPSIAIPQISPLASGPFTSAIALRDALVEQAILIYVNDTM